jgi:hypothetical protein
VIADVAMKGLCDRLNNYSPYIKSSAVGNLVVAFTGNFTCTSTRQLSE